MALAGAGMHAGAPAAGPRVPIWLDCDPGHDDAMALLLAGYSPRLRLLGVSTVHGNQSVDKTTHNALRWMHACGLAYVPVVAGASRPLLRPPIHCPDIHGESGLDSFGATAVEWPPLPSDRRPVASKAVSYTYHCVHNHRASTGEKATLVATGALTNVALLLSVYPEIRDDLECIVVMGGSTGRGNTGAVAEFNLQIDPEAAAIVFNSAAHKVPLVMVPLDVTHTALVTHDVLMAVAAGDGTSGRRGAGGSLASPLRSGSAGSPASGGSAGAAVAPAAGEGAGRPPQVDACLAAASSPFRKLTVGLLSFFARTYAEVFGMPSPPLHDPCAVMWAVDRTAFTAKRCHVAIETASPHSLGQSVVDLINIGKHADEELNATVALTIRLDVFWPALLAAVAAADARSCLNVAALPTSLPPLSRPAATGPASPPVLATAPSSFGSSRDAAATGVLGSEARESARSSTLPPLSAGGGVSTASLLLASGHGSATPSARFMTPRKGGGDGEEPRGSVSSATSAASPSAREVEAAVETGGGFVSAGGDGEGERERDGDGEPSVDTASAQVGEGEEPVAAAAAVIVAAMAADAAAATAEAAGE